MFLQILGAWVLADLMSGLAHFALDRSKFKGRFFDSINADNELHHQKPMALLKNSLWENISTTAPATLPLSLALYLLGAPLLLWLAFFFLSFGNIVHRWAHTPAARLPFGIPLLQRCGLFLSPLEHGKHHFRGNRRVPRAEAYGRWCVMSDWANYIIDALAK